MLAILMLVLIGGAAIGLLLARPKGRSSKPWADPFGPNTTSTDVINMARIKVAGVGGLAMVCVALIAGLDIPEIGQLQAIALAFGILFAVGLILWRRRRGPMPSSGGQMGANTVLSIDSPQTNDDAPTPPSVSSQVVTAQ